MSGGAQASVAILIKARDMRVECPELRHVHGVVELPRVLGRSLDVVCRISESKPQKGPRPCHTALLGLR